MKFELIGLFCSGLSLILNECRDDIIKNFSYFKDYCKGLTHKQQFKESFKKNFAKTGTEMINYLKKRPYYYFSNHVPTSHLNLFTDIIENQIKFDLNYLCDFYFGLEDKEDSLFICLCPFEQLHEELEKRIFYVGYSVEINYHYSVNKLQASEGTFDNFPITDGNPNCFKRGIVMLNFKSHIFGSFKIPVYCEEDYDIDQKVILTTKKGNKCFVFDCLPEYAGINLLKNYPVNSPFDLTNENNLKTGE